MVDLDFNASLAPAARDDMCPLGFNRGVVIAFR